MRRGRARAEIRAASVARNATVLAGATLVARLLGFALAIVMARALGTGDYGRYALALALGQVLVPVADLGLTPYLSREAARHAAGAEARLRTLLKAKLALVAGTLMLTAVGAVVLLDDRELILVIAAMTTAAMADTLSAFAYAYFQGRESMGFEARTTTLVAVARGAGGIAIIAAGGELGAVVAWVLGVSLVQTVFVGARLRAVTHHGVRAAEPARVDRRAVLSMGLMSLFVFTYLRIDTVLIGLISDEEAVGLYAAAYTIMLGAQIAPWMISMALTPVFARTFGRDPRAFAKSWRQGLRTVLLIALPIAVGGTVLADELIDRAYGDAYAAASDALAVLVWACPLGALGTIVQSTLRAASREGWLVRVSGTCAAFNIAANLWAIPHYGITGAAAVTVSTELISAVVLLVLARRAGIVGSPRFPAARVALALLALAGAALATAGVAVELAVVGGVVAYGAALVVLGVVTPTELRQATAFRRPSPVE